MVNGGAMDSDDYELKFDKDISEDERKFYLKLFPTVDLVKEKKTHCTSCNVHLGTAPANENNIYMHPILRVSQCKKCNEFYNSGEFSKGEDGSELYCRWCGQGGEVYCCAKCPFVFCKACISINLAKSLVVDIRDNENWNCFVCSPKITWPIRATHWALTNYIEKQKKLIKESASSEVEQRRHMKRDNSTCCTRYKAECDAESSRDSDISISKKRNPEPESSDDSDVPLSKTCNLSVVKKRKKSDDCNSNIGEVKSKQQSIAVTPKITSVSTVLKTPQQQQSVLPTTINLSSVIGEANLMQSKTNQPFLINNIAVQTNKNLTPITTPIRPPTTYRTQHVSSIPGAQSAVKIVQLPQQTVQNQHRIQMHLPSQQPTPPPLLIRNRCVQIRPHVNVLNGQQNLNLNQNRTSTTVQLGIRQTGEHAPVYHNIGGFCIDLNSAAQHDSIRLPNGKLIQVKKSTTNSPNNASNMRQQIPSGVLTPIQNQPQHQFTITQSAGPLPNVSSASPLPTVSNTNSNQVTIQPASIQQHQQPQSIQTVPASSILPNASGQVQIINGNLVQTIPASISSQPRPLLIRNYPNTPIGKARSQLQSQIFSAMEICQHLSTKLQTLTNSNPYKNANSLGDVKELYIHLSYLLTYGIGRLKSMQDKVAEDMTNMGFKTNVSNLVKGQPSTEKYSSDGDEDEIEIVEPKTTTITLDSDNEDNEDLSSSSAIVKDPTTIDKNVETKPANPTKQVARKQIQSLQRRITSTPGYRLIAPKAWQTNQEGKEPSLQFIQQTPQQTQNSQENSHNSVNSEEPNSEQQNVLGNDDDFSTLSLLAGMLEVELTEGDVKVQPTSGQKKPRKKLTNRPNPNLIKKNAEYNNNKILDLKRNDTKLKQKCKVNVISLDKKSDYFQEVFNRFQTHHKKNLQKESQVNNVVCFKNKDISEKALLTQENKTFELKANCSNANADSNLKAIVNEVNLANTKDSEQLKENDCESEEIKNFEEKEAQIISKESKTKKDEMKDNNVSAPEEKQIQINIKDTNISNQSEEKKDQISSKDFRDSKNFKGKKVQSISKDSEEKLEKIRNKETKLSKESEEVESDVNCKNSDDIMESKNKLNQINNKNFEIRENFEEKGTNNKNSSNINKVSEVKENNSKDTDFPEEIEGKKDIVNSKEKIEGEKDIVNSKGTNILKKILENNDDTDSNSVSSINIKKKGSEIEETLFVSENVPSSDEQLTDAAFEENFEIDTSSRTTEDVEDVIIMENNISSNSILHENEINVNDLLNDSKNTNEIDDEEDPLIEMLESLQSSIDDDKYEPTNFDNNSNLAIKEKEDIKDQNEEDTESYPLLDIKFNEVNAKKLNYIESSSNEIKILEGNTEGKNDVDGKESDDIA